MTGPEHYQAAEEAIQQAVDNDNWMARTYYAAIATAHATAAAAAATAAAAALPGFGADSGTTSP